MHTSGRCHILSQNGLPTMKAEITDGIWKLGVLLVLKVE